MMSGSRLNVDPLEIIEQWRPSPRLEMVAFNHIKHNAVGNNVSPFIKKVGKCTNLHTGGDDVGEIVDCETSGTLSPMTPLLLRVSDTGRCNTTCGLPTTLTALHPRV